MLPPSDFKLNLSLFIVMADVRKFVSVWTDWKTTFINKSKYAFNRNERTSRVITYVHVLLNPSTEGGQSSGTDSYESYMQRTYWITMFRIPFLLQTLRTPNSNCIFDRKRCSLVKQIESAHCWLAVWAKEGRWREDRPKVNFTNKPPPRGLRFTAGYFITPHQATS